MYLADSDFPSAIETIQQMIKRMEPTGEHHFLYLLLGRIYLKVSFIRDLFYFGLRYDHILN